MLKAPLWLASLLVAFRCIPECHGARFAGPALHHGHHQQQHRRLKGNVTAMGRVDVHPPFRLFQALSKKYEISEPHAEVNADATIVVSAFSKPEISDEVSNGGDGNADNTNEDSEGDADAEDTGGENFVAIRTQKSVPLCTPRPMRAPRTPVAAVGDNDEDLSEQVSAESPAAAAATSPGTEVSKDSGSESTAPSSSGSTASSSGSEMSQAIITGEGSSSPNGTMTPNSQTPGINSSAPKPTLTSPTAAASNTSSSPSASLGNSSSPGNQNSGSDVAAGFADQDQSGGSSSNSVDITTSPANDDSSKSQIAGIPPSPSSQPSSDLLSSKPSTSSDTAPCIPMSIERDATYCVPPSDNPDLSCSGPVPTRASSSSSLSFDPNRICPRKGGMAIAGCHPGLRSFNLTSNNSCIAPEDSRCIAIHTGVWGCAFSFSPSSKVGSAASISSGTIASDSNPQGSTTLQASAASSSVTATNFQTQNNDRGGSESQPIVLVVAAIAACVLAVLAVVKRSKQRDRQNVSEREEAAVQGHETDFSYYPKTPKLSKASEGNHTFT